MNGEFDSLPSDVRDALAGARGVSIPGDARARLAERLAVSVAGFGPAHAPSAASAAPAAAGALSGAAAKLVLVLAIAGAVAGLVGAARSSSTSKAPPHAVPVVARELASRTSRVVTFAPDVRRDETRETTPPQRASATAVPPLTPEASLRAEQTLLDQARRAIVSGNPADALSPLKTHAERFPHGVLAEERDALRIRALAKLGRSDEARALLGRLRRDHPQSFLLDGAEADVEAIP